jgi:hypothetical protein
VAQEQSTTTASGQSSNGASGQTTVQGCLQASNGTYTLTSDSGTTYQLQGDTSKLSKHNGHEMQITGSTAGTGSASSEMSQNSPQTLTVVSFKHISKTCKKGTM